MNASLGNNADEAEQRRPSGREETAFLQSFPTMTQFQSRQMVP